MKIYRGNYTVPGTEKAVRGTLYEQGTILKFVPDGGEALIVPSLDSVSRKREIMSEGSRASTLVIEARVNPRVR